VNYIAQLQADLAEERAKLAATRAAIADLRSHLHGNKFQGCAPDGSRKDWIATADVWRWIELALAAGN
jgi:hypothetical protein